MVIGSIGLFFFISHAMPNACTAVQLCVHRLLKENGHSVRGITCSFSEEHYGNMLMFHVVINTKPLGIHLKNYSFQ